MDKGNTLIHNPELDLFIERVIDVPRTLVWRAWTDADILKQWFCPVPWSVSHCEIDLRPGGKFYTVMRSPEGEDFPSTGCYLEIIENEKLIWTDALGPGFRPSDEPFFTGMITLEDHAGGTKYTARGLHATADIRQRHEAMGFHDGWNAALDQLVALVKRL